MLLKGAFRLLGPFASAAFVGGTVRFFGWDAAIAKMMGVVATSSQLTAITLMLAGLGGAAALLGALVFRVDERLYSILGPDSERSSLANDDGMIDAGLRSLPRGDAIAPSPPLLPADLTVRDALSDLVSRALALEHYSASYHAATIFNASPAEQWEQDYALWEDSAVTLLKRMGRAATAGVLRNIRAPRRTIYVSMALAPIGVDPSKINRLRGQRELLEMVQGECR